MIFSIVKLERYFSQRVKMPLICYAMIPVSALVTKWVGIIDTVLPVST